MEEQLKTLEGLKGRDIIWAMIDGKLDESIIAEAKERVIKQLDSIAKAIENAKILEKDFNDLAERYNKLIAEKEVPGTEVQVQEYEEKIKTLKGEMDIYKDKIKTMESQDLISKSKIEEFEKKASETPFETATGFFNTIGDILTDTLSVTMAIKKVDSELTVSIIPKPSVKDDGFKAGLPPINIIGTGNEIDAGIFDVIKGKLELVSKVSTDLAEYEKLVEEALAKSEMKKKEKEEADKKKKEAKDKIDKIKEVIKKITDPAELNKKWGEVIKLDPKDKEALEFIESNKPAELF